MCFVTGQITEQESLFFYESGVGTSNYSNPDLMPTFKSDIVANAPDEVTTYCGGNAECIFDYSVSGSQDVAAVTLWSNENYKLQETQACMLSKRLYCMCI